MDGSEGEFVRRVVEEAYDAKFGHVSVTITYTEKDDKGDLCSPQYRVSVEQDWPGGDKGCPTIEFSYHPEDVTIDTITLGPVLGGMMLRKLDTVARQLFVGSSQARVTTQERALFVETGYLERDSMMIKRFPSTRKPTLADILKQTQ